MNSFIRLTLQMYRRYYALFLRSQKKMQKKENFFVSIGGDKPDYHPNGGFSPTGTPKEWHNTETGVKPWAMCMECERGWVKFF